MSEVREQASSVRRTMLVATGPIVVIHLSTMGQGRLMDLFLSSLSE
jgi:hypothetical protein